jgi:hypothetical protein
VYAKEKGRLPNRLQDLAALHLPGTLPLDFYGGGDFHYSATNRLFWSVGLNGQSDVTPKTFLRHEQYASDDLIVRLP